MDYIGATPMQNPLLGLLAERLKQAQEFAAKPFGYSNPPAEMLMNLLGVPAVQQTAERMAYGEPLTTGRGMTTQIRPEAVEAALTVAPAAGLLGRGVERGAMAAGRAGERYAEQVVPQIMERGGLPAQLLEDLSQGSRRQIFIGAESPLYDKDAALKASQMLKKGVPAQQVWAETGTAKFGDDFVQEISDQGARFNTAEQIAQDAEKIRQRNLELKGTIKESQSTYPDLFPKELTAARRPLREEIKQNQNMLERNFGYESDPSWAGQLAPIAFEHPSLYQAYPELKGAVIRQGRNAGGELLGSYEEPARGGAGLLEITKKGLQKDPTSTSTHEMQHAIQGLEGWERGGSPEEFLRSAIQERDLIYAKIEDLNKEMSAAVGTPKYEDLMAQRMALVSDLQSKGYDDMSSIGTKAFDQYQRLAGEAQARLAQTRMNLSPEERRQFYPFEEKTDVNKYGLDVKPEDLIYRGGLLGQPVSASRESFVPGVEAGKEMIVHHNISPQKLANVEKVGGMPVPSIAVSNVDNPMVNFGDISLIGPKEMAIPSAKNPVYGFDAYTARAPKIDYQIDAKSAKNLQNMFADVADDVGDYELSRLTQNWEDRKYSKPMMAKFLKEKGALPDKKDFDDGWKYNQALSDGVYNLNAEYGDWLNEFNKRLPDAGVNIKERIFKGFTDSGNRRYAPVTLENLVKEMKGGAGSEGFMYGVGNIRAVATPKFKNLNQVKAARESIVTPEKFEPIKKQINEAYDSLSDRLSKLEGNSGYTYDPSDALYEIGQSRNVNFMDKIYKDVPESLKADVQIFLNKVREMPTEYFEIKPQRAVQVGEFKGAILPANVPKQSIEYLRSQGLQDLYYYSTPEERKELFKKFGPEMFGTLPLGLLGDEEIRNRLNLLD